MYTLFFICARKIRKFTIDLVGKKLTNS